MGNSNNIKNLATCPSPAQPIPKNATSVFKGLIFEVFQWKQLQFDETEVVFEKARRPDTVVILPILDDGRIVLCQQEQSGCKPFISCFGGRVEEGEDATNAARRELLEESGYAANELTLWEAHHPITKLEWVVYTFIAKGITTQTKPKVEPGEMISPFFITFDELVELSLDSKFREGHIAFRLLKAKSLPNEMKKIRKLFQP
ncbi:MAG: NUDIX hydrolase [Candidatus Electrothrix communis]|nr:MAG: NUDIX hydrolase [Candidatus Electrothrix communis]